MSRQLLLTVGGDGVHCCSLMSAKGVTQLSGRYIASTVILLWPLDNFMCVATFGAVVGPLVM